MSMYNKTHLIEIAGRHQKKKKQNTRIYERDTLQLVVDIEPPNSSQISGLSCAYPSTPILNFEATELVDGGPSSS